MWALLAALVLSSGVGSASRVAQSVAPSTPVTIWLEGIELSDTENYDAAVVARALRARVLALRACVLPLASRRQQREESLAVSLAFDPRGRVTQARAEGFPQDPVIVRCVLTVLRSVRVRPSDEGGLRLSLRLVARPF